MKQNNGKLKIAVAALSVAVVLCGLLIAWLLIAGQKAEPQSGGMIARVYQDNVVVYEADLSKVTEPYTYRVEGADGAYNDILFEPGKVSCKEANCPDQVCVHMGAIDSGVLPIVCLPHKVIVKIETAG